MSARVKGDEGDISVSCPELRADMQPYHMICPINLQRYMATGKLYFSVDGKVGACLEYVTL